jgi:hypothetical protein
MGMIFLRLGQLKKQCFPQKIKRKIRDKYNFAGKIPILTSSGRNLWWAIKLKEKLQISDLN